MNHYIDLPVSKTGKLSDSISEAFRKLGIRNHVVFRLSATAYAEVEFNGILMRYNLDLDYSTVESDRLKSPSIMVFTGSLNNIMFADIPGYPEMIDMAGDKVTVRSSNFLHILDPVLSASQLFPKVEHFGIRTVCFMEDKEAERAREVANKMAHIKCNGEGYPQAVRLYDGKHYVMIQNSAIPAVTHYRIIEDVFDLPYTQGISNLTVNHEDKSIYRRMGLYMIETFTGKESRIRCFSDNNIDAFAVNCDSAIEKLIDLINKDLEVKGVQSRALELKKYDEVVAEVSRLSREENRTALVFEYEYIQDDNKIRVIGLCN